MKKLSFRRKWGSVALAAVMTTSLFTGLSSTSVNTSSAATSKESVNQTRLLETYDQIQAPENGHYSPRSNTYHAAETLMSETPDYDISRNPGSFTVTAEEGDGEITLTWTAAPRAERYIIQRATSMDGPYELLNTNVTDTNYTDTGLSNGTTYYYVVIASNQIGTQFSTVIATPGADATAPSVPSAPNGITASVTLKWNASEGATSYTIKRSTSANGPFTVIATGVTAASYTDNILTAGNTYYYTITAVNEAGESANSSMYIVTLGNAGSGHHHGGGNSRGNDGDNSATPTDGLVVQYRTAETNAADNQIKPHFNIVNHGTTAVDLRDLKLRYYFSKDGGGSMRAWIDWARIGASNIQTRFTDDYVELSFANGAGNLSAGNETGEIQLRMAKSDWSNFDETNDYSYDGTITSYANWDRVALYHNDQLVWGITP